MTVTYNNTLRLADLATGTEVGTWGEITDTNICSLLTQAVAGYTGITLNNDAIDYVLTALNGQVDQARSAVLGFGGPLAVTKNIIIPNAVKLYHVFNWVSGGGTIVIKPTAGSGVAIPAGQAAIVWCDGANTASFLAGALSNYLPRSGGVLTGQLVVQNQGLVLQSTYAGGNSSLFIQAYPGNPATLYFGDLNAARWLVYDDNYGMTGGDAGGNFQIVALHDNGSWLSTAIWIRRNDLTISMVGPTVFNSTTTMSGTATFNGLLQSNAGLNSGGQTNVQNISVNGTVWGRPDGWLYIGHATHFYGGIQVDGSVNTSTGVNSAGDARVNALFAPAGVYAGGDTDIGMYRGANERQMQFAAGWRWQWQNADGLLGWVGGGGGGGYFWVMRWSDNLCYNQRGSVGGYGAYANFSDRRSKTNVAVSQRGLDAILKLQPVEFTRVAPPAGKMLAQAPMRRELGFVAQDVMGIIPEAVTKFGYTLPDGSGGLDGPDPTLALDTDAILATMVNAIKTLAARVATLEGRRA